MKRPAPTHFEFLIPNLLREKDLGSQKVQAGFTQHHFSVNSVFPNNAFSRITTLLRKLLSRKSGAGFTMVELLVYIGISSIALVVFMNFAIATTTNSAKSRKTLELQQNSRLILDRLSQMVRSSTPLTWTASSLTASSTTISLTGNNLIVGTDNINSPNVSVDSFSISPATTTAQPQLITVSFILSTKNSSPVQTLPITTTLIPHQQLY